MGRVRGHPSVNKPRFIMAKPEILIHDVKTKIAELENFRAEWVNTMQEVWNFKNRTAKNILLELYTISGNIILALNQVAAGNYRDKLAMLLVLEKLKDFTHSEEFLTYDTLGEYGCHKAITPQTKQRIKIMFDCLEFLTA